MANLTNVKVNLFNFVLQIQDAVHKLSRQRFPLNVKL